MANANRPAGLVPVGYLNGANWSGKARMYCIPETDDSNAYAIGDPLVLAGSADAQGVPTVILATGGTNQVLGSFVGFVGLKYGQSGADPNANGTIVIPATKSQAYYVLVADDPNIIFEIQEDSDAGSIAAASVSANFNLVAGANNGFISGWQLDSSSVGTGATQQARLLMAKQQADNALGTYCKWLVLLNNHCYRVGQLGL